MTTHKRNYRQTKPRIASFTSTLASFMLTTPVTLIFMSC
jgi:hypothetical protein